MSTYNRNVVIFRVDTNYMTLYFAHNAFFGMRQPMCCRTFIQHRQVQPVCHGYHIYNFLDFPSQYALSRQQSKTQWEFVYLRRGMKSFWSNFHCAMDMTCNISYQFIRITKQQLLPNIKYSIDEKSINSGCSRWSVVYVSISITAFGIAAHPCDRAWGYSDRVGEDFQRKKCCVWFDWVCIR